jgi:hypothetical protein
LPVSIRALLRRSGLSAQKRFWGDFSSFPHLAIMIPDAMNSTLLNESLLVEENQ